MTSKKAVVLGFVGALLVAVGFGATAYASPLLEQGRDKKIQIVRREQSPVFLHKINDGHAAREKARPVVASRKPAHKPVCHWSHLEQTGGVVVVHGVSYDTSRVQICE